MVANAFAPPTFTAGSLPVDVLDSSANTAWPADNRYGYFLFGTPSPSCSPSPSVTPISPSPSVTPISLTASSSISPTASISVSPSSSPTASISVSPSSSPAASVSTSPMPSTTTSAFASAVSPSVTSSVSLIASVTQSISKSSSQSSSPSPVSPSRCPPCPHLAIPHGDHLDPSFQSLSTSVVSASASRSLSKSASRSASRSPALATRTTIATAVCKVQQLWQVPKATLLSRLACGVKTRLAIHPAFQ
eukprot:g56424.t1